MRAPFISALTLIAVLATPALASMGGSAPPEPPQGSQPELSNNQLTPRQQAEQLYGSAYDDIAKANLDVANGKDKNAQKKFKRALDHATEAVGLDSTYFEAWNLVGFASRKLGDYPHSLSAYGRCLAIQPGYAPAREYLGEAYLELGRVHEAREQLSWLQRLNAPDQTKILAARIDAWQAAHPDSLAPAPAASPASAPADSVIKPPASGSGF
jgi:tetratricopeptide (TPR) repeat protein